MRTQKLSGVLAVAAMGAPLLFSLCLSRGTEAANERLPDPTPAPGQPYRVHIIRSMTDPRKKTGAAQPQPSAVPAPVSQSTPVASTSAPQIASSAPAAVPAIPPSPPPVAVRAPRPRASAPTPSAVPTASASSRPAVAGSPPKVPDTIATAPPPSVAPPAPDAGICPKVDFNILLANLRNWSHAYRQNELRVYTDHECAQSNVVCLDRFGDASNDKVPERVAAGQPLTAYAIVPVVDRAQMAISTSMRASVARADAPADETATPAPGAPGVGGESICHPSAAQLQSLRIAAAPIAELGGRAGLESLGLPNNSWNESYWTMKTGPELVDDWASWVRIHRGRVPEFESFGTKIDVLSSDVGIDVDFTRTERGSRASASSQHYTLAVDNGRYYLEASLLVPVIFRGSRSVHLTPSAAGTELQIGIEQDWHVTGAAMLNYFPFGRQKGELSSFRNCRNRSCYQNWLGAQFGTGLDNPLKDWYLGLVFEPISGLAFGVGASLLKGEFLGAGLAEGMLLPTASALSVQSEYMVRPYFGVAITTDILQVIDRGTLSVRQLR